jgi:GntR family transcriptional regulator, histidine utilization repressor
MVSRKEILAEIRDRIRTGTWPPGFRLPSTPKLAEEFGVGESTVHHAMATLIDSGEIVSIPGGNRYVPPLPRPGGNA